MSVENYIIPLQKAYNKPRTRRANVAMKLIFDFVYKHKRKTKDNVFISNEVNAYIWKKSIEKPPRKIAVILKEKDSNIYVFLKDSKELAKFLKPKEKAKKSIKDSIKEVKENMNNPTSKKSKAKDKKVSKPVKETPVKESPKKEPVKETPKESPVKEAPKETQKESPKETPKEESK